MSSNRTIISVIRKTVFNVFMPRSSLQNQYY
jgi:hypothetical protein